MIPHEFQWHEQLALLIGAAGAVAALSARLASPLRSAHRRSIGIAWSVGLTLLAVGPSVPSMSLADSSLTYFDSRWVDTLKMARWMRERTPLDAVFACNPDASYILSGLTGRKFIVLPRGLMNPASDADARYADVREMLTTPDEGVFRRLAARYGATYLLADPSPAAKSAYSSWSCLEPAFSDDRFALVYRIHGD